MPSSAQHCVTVLAAQTPADMARLAVSEIREGRADILIKGAVDSGAYLKAVVNRDTGIAVSRVLSNISIAELPGFGRLIGATDNGILPAPTCEQKRAIIQNSAALWRGLGVVNPKVALVAATEKVTPAMPATIDAATLVRQGANGFLLAGPMGYDMAISPRAAAIKGAAADGVSGCADMLVFPNIEAANAVVKSWKFHANAQTGSIVLGGRVPILLNSRSDGAQARLNGLLLAIAMLRGQQ
ncbi:MAG: phosphate acyltransferase [Cognatishimia activa]